MLTANKMASHKYIAPEHVRKIKYQILQFDNSGVKLRSVMWQSCAIYALYTPQPGMHQMNTNISLFVMGMKTGSVKKTLNIDQYCDYSLFLLPPRGQKVT